MHTQLIILTLLPIILMLSLGALLSRLRFLGNNFMADLNKLVFWVALPSFIFRNILHVESPGSAAWKIFLCLMACTLLVTVLAWLTGFFLPIPRRSIGTTAQGAFRGNQAYIGIPTLVYSIAALDPSQKNAIIGTAMLTLAPTMILYNFLAVIVLQASQHQISMTGLRAMCKSLCMNPLIITSITAISALFLGFKLPPPLDRTLESLGNMAVPVALLCIGGSLAQCKLHDRIFAVCTATLFKLALLPLLAYFFGIYFELSQFDLRILLIFASCPTAAASYIMARQMGGDESLASGIIALTTILSFIPLSIVLIMTN